MSILIGTGLGLLFGIGLTCQYWSTRHTVGGSSIWAPLFFGPAMGAIVGLVVFMVIKV